mmetsp:Transcript_25607/g.65822  ORF Transcript_25607/g.65822 Transcript_25607/m.65822 type:complete len:574 (-) Transcript_25607:54-1775(-)
MDGRHQPGNLPLQVTSIGGSAAAVLRELIGKPGPDGLSALPLKGKYTGMVQDICVEIGIDMNLQLGPDAFAQMDGTSDGPLSVSVEGHAFSGPPMLDSERATLEKQIQDLNAALERERKDVGQMKLALAAAGKREEPSSRPAPKPIPGASAAEVEGLQARIRSLEAACHAARREAVEADQLRAALTSREGRIRELSRTIGELQRERDESHQALKDASQLNGRSSREAEAEITSLQMRLLKQEEQMKELQAERDMWRSRAAQDTVGNSRWCDAPAPGARAAEAPSITQAALLADAARRGPSEDDARGRRDRASEGSTGRESSADSASKSIYDMLQLLKAERRKLESAKQEVFSAGNSEEGRQSPQIERPGSRGQGRSRIISRAPVTATTQRPTRGIDGDRPLTPSSSRWGAPGSVVYRQPLVLGSALSSLNQQAEQLLRGASSRSHSPLPPSMVVSARDRSMSPSLRASNPDSPSVLARRAGPGLPGGPWVPSTLPAQWGPGPSLRGPQMYPSAPWVTPPGSQQQLLDPAPPPPQIPLPPTQPVPLSWASAPWFAKDQSPTVASTPGAPPMAPR